ncbi:hypothetical protein ACIQMR_36145 [Streptomyces sp. NPDC091376]|uniref:hypothetical protein n=1 Tax=Streptomyces sp. NPDC091376 TaxID=3365994 RepID=UPI0037FC6D77
MTTSSWDRTRRIAAAACVLTVIAGTVGMLVLAAGSSVPAAWWPHTGQAFTADARPAHQDPCDLIAGPAKEYCERGTPETTSAEHQGTAGAAWTLVPAGAGTAALLVWRLRRTSGQRRR